MRLRILLVLLVAVLVGCVPAAGPTPTPDEPTPSSEESPSESIATPDASLPVEPTDEPVVTPEPSPTIEPTDEPSGPSPSESAGSGAADACSGSDQNRDFFEDAAAALDWTVYCAVLPSGWFVDSGEYRRAGGGKLEIAYRGPGGARLELREGAFCADGASCVPSGIEVGEAAFGDQNGALIATDAGGWALVVDGDAAISWLAIGNGLDEEEFRALATALSVVSD